MIGFLARYKLWIFGLVSAGVYALNLRLAEAFVEIGIFEAVPNPIVSYLIQIAPLGLLYFLAVKMILRRPGSHETLTAVLLFALLFRLPLIPLDPALSTDVYRYLWEGKVQVAAGVNPYVVPPEDESLASLRDEAIYPNINRKWAPTVYPAASQLFFALAYRMGIESPEGFKVVALAADALTLLLLLLILKELQYPLSRVIVYAWNPLLVYEFFWSGHLETFMLPPLLAFLYLFLRGRMPAAGVALGLATAIKFVPVFLLATVPPRQRLRAGVPFVGVVALAYLFYAGAGRDIVGFLPTYFSDPYEIFNLGPLQLGLLWASKYFSFPLFWVRTILFALLCAILLIVSHRPATAPRDIIRKSYVILSAYLLLIYPAFHPWYLCTLLPLLCFVPSRAWLVFSLLLPLSYLKYLTPNGTMPVWITIAQFVPLYLLLILERGRLAIGNEIRQPDAALQREAVAEEQGSSIRGQRTPSPAS